MATRSRAWTHLRAAPRVLATGEDLRNARVVPLPGSGYWCLMEGGAAKRFDRLGKLAFAKLASG